MSDDAQTQHWVDAEDGYQLALEGRRLICRNPDGETLAAVPRKLMRGEAARRLLALGAMLVEHEKACEDTVERWMLHAQPIQARVLAEVWSDLAWRNLLEHLVVVAVGPSGEWNPRHVGLLMDVHAEARLELLRFDQKELQVQPAQVMIPHPAVLEHLSSFLRLIHQEGIVQSIPQLQRMIWLKPAELDPTAQVVDTFRGQVEASPEAMALRARRLGYRVQSGYAVCALQEWGRAIQARLWIGDRDPAGATHLGELQWVDGQGRALSLGMVGPVAFSEGHLMAQRLCQEQP
jgi:hypothetical protein